VNRSQRGTLLPILVLVLMSGLTLTRALMRQGMSPILATVPLRLDASREVDVALARRQGRLLIVNAGLVQAFRYAHRCARLRDAGRNSLHARDGGPPPAVDERAGLVFVPNLVDDAVYALDARGGRVQRILHVGSRPDAITVDARTGRLFVASTADWTLTTLDAHTGAVLRTETVGVGDLPGQLAMDLGRAHFRRGRRGAGVGHAPRRLRRQRPRGTRAARGARRAATPGRRGHHRWLRRARRAQWPGAVAAVPGYRRRRAGGGRAHGPCACRERRRGRACPRPMGLAAAPTPSLASLPPGADPTPARDPVAPVCA